MSLEDKIEKLTAAVEANTAALLGSKPAAAAKTSASEAAPKKGPGRPKKEAAPAKDDADDGLGDDADDGLGDDADDGLGGDEPQYSYEDLLKLMLSLRDIGGKGENKADCRAVIQKFGVSNFKELDGETEKYDEVAEFIKSLAKKRKVNL